MIQTFSTICRQEMTARTYFYYKDRLWIAIFLSAVALLIFHIHTEPHWANVEKSNGVNIIAYIQLAVFLPLWFFAFSWISRLTDQRFTLSGTTTGFFLGMLCHLVFMLFYEPRMFINDISTVLMIALTESLSSGFCLFGFGVGLGTTLIFSMRKSTELTTNGR